MKKPKKRGGISDRERLEMLRRNGKVWAYFDSIPGGDGFYAEGYWHLGQSARLFFQAIDAAIRAERRAGAKQR